MNHQARRSVTATVGVTGATGFIGARLVELLAEGDGPIQPRPLMRPRVGRPGMPGGRRIDLLDAVAVAEAVEGCAAVVHCAFDFTDLRANIQIARVLGLACATMGVRLVHVSTAAVYEPLPDGELDETGGSAGPGSDYKQIKLAIEAVLIQLSHDNGLDVIILQPTIVYGPAGRAWTDSPARELLTGTVVLPNGGGGLCNAVYVDDVCQAVIAALSADMPSGERILVSGAAPVTWRDFYGAYQAALGLDAVHLEAGVGSVAGPSEASGRRAAIKRVGTRLVGARTLSRLNLAAAYASGLVRQRRHLAAGPKLALFTARCHIRIDKARTLLGYNPHYDLARGMHVTGPYLRATYGRLARFRRLRSAATPPAG